MGFSKGEPEATSKARNLRGRRPRGFLAFGLAEDVAKGSPLEDPEGSIHHDPSEAFPQIFILFT